jgi:glycosyltransferase involved in cell wall biosynthesis
MPPDVNPLSPTVSVILPVFNERGFLPSMYDQLVPILNSLNAEIIWVNDGSKDGSGALLDALAANDPRVSVLHFARNFGQTAALAAGLAAARGDIFVCMDADGQNDPADIPRLVQAIRDGADVVSGWRKHRRDPWLTRRLPSEIANGLISRVTQVSLHDHGCTLKAYRRDMFKRLRLYGEMHRFIPVWCAWEGAKIVELEVTHHPRRQGKSKYGIGRTFRVILDLLTVKFFSSYLGSPNHVLGGIGLGFLGLGFLAGLFPFLDKFVWNQWGPLRIPALILSVFLGILGVQSLILGLLAEILIRIYYENKNERPYRVARTVGPATPSAELRGQAAPQRGDSPADQG